MPADGPPNATSESSLHDLLGRVVGRFGGAIEFWTVVCLSRRELGDPEPFVAEQWNDLYSEVHQIRSLIGEADVPSPVVQEQVAKLTKTGSDLREGFDWFLDCGNVSLPELERAVVRLGSIWHEVRLRVAFLAALIPLPAPLPHLTAEQEAYYQSILDSLFDKLAGARPVTFTTDREFATLT
jgi:hypothetical protein